MQDRRKYIFQMLKEKYGQPRMLNTMNVSFKNESEIIFFFQIQKKKEKLGEEISSPTCTLKKAKKILQVEENDNRWKCGST